LAELTNRTTVEADERCTVGSLKPEALLAGSRELGEPHWLLGQRAAFLRRFRDTGLPAPFEEDWRGTDLRQFGLDRSTVVRAAAGPAARLASSGIDLSPPPTRRSGSGEATLLPLGEAVKRQADLLRTHLFAGGAFFHLPREAVMEGVARIAWQPASDEAADFPHNLVVLEPGSRGSLVERFSGPWKAGRTGTCCSVTEVVVGPGAQLDILTLIDQDAEVSTCHTAVARVAAGGRLRWYLGSTGGRMVRADIEVTLAGPQAESRIIGVGVGRGRRHLDHRTVQRHAAPDTRSTIIFGTLLRGRSRSIYRGLICMDQGAERADAYQKNDNLLLEPGPGAEAIPKLEILTDDVKCSHGSTVGRLREEELFYASARGIRPWQARDLVAEGFIRRVLSGGGEWNPLTEELFKTVRGEVIDDIQPYDPSE